MSAVGLFALGVVVTLIVGAGLSLLVLGAVLDGRDEALAQGRGGSAGAQLLRRSTSLVDVTRGDGRPGSAGRSQRSE